MGDHYRGQGQSMDRLAEPPSIMPPSGFTPPSYAPTPEEPEPKKNKGDDKKPKEDGEGLPLADNILQVGPFSLDMDKLKSVPGIIRGLNVGLLLIMLVMAIAGKGASGAFKFQIFCWVLFTPMTIFLTLKDYSVEGPPKMLGEQFQFSFVRVVAFGAAAVLVLIGSLAAWSKNEGKGTLQAAGAFGTLTGVTFGASAFFAFQMHKELQAPTPDENPEEKKSDESKEPNGTANGPPGGPPINRHSKPNTVSGGTNFDDLHGQQSMNVRVRDINDMSMGYNEPPIPERGHTLQSRSNVRDLNQGERVGYRGQMMYNEPYEGGNEPHILENPQPLAGITHRDHELDLNVNDLGGTLDQYGRMQSDPYDIDPYGRDMDTLPRDMTMGHGMEMGYGGSIPAPSFSPTQLASGPSDDALMLARSFHPDAGLNHHDH